MARKCFYSFYYKEDNWRVSQVKGIGSIEGQPVISGNQWEEVEKGGPQAIKRWIDNQMIGRSCLIVLVGANTANRPWVKYEIEKAWKEKKGVFAVRIHNLLDRNSRQSLRGGDPFASFTHNQKPLGNWAKVYDPPYTESTKVYQYIAANIETWVEEAIKLRNAA